jgi:hypothetical protein
MLSQRSPAVARVGFKDLDWEEEKGKSIKGLRRRQQEKDRRHVLRNKRIMSNQQLQAFAQFAIADEENAKNTRELGTCDYLLERALEKEFVTFDSGQTVDGKVSQLLGMIDALSQDKQLRAILMAWMYEAEEKEYFSIPADTDSLACSSFTTGSGGGESESSQVHPVDLDAEKLKTFKNGWHF